MDRDTAWGIWGEDRRGGGDVLADDSPRDLTCPGSRTFLLISAIMMAGKAEQLGQALGDASG